MSKGPFKLLNKNSCFYHFRFKIQFTIPVPNGREFMFLSYILEVKLPTSGIIPLNAFWPQPIFMGFEVTEIINMKFLASLKTLFKLPLLSNGFKSTQKPHKIHFKIIALIFCARIFKSVDNNPATYQFWGQHVKSFLKLHYW